LVAIPFHSLGGQTGVLAVTSSFPNVFGPADVRQLGLFGVLASIMLDNFRLYQAEAAERSALHAVQSSMAEGLVVGDPQGLVRYWNRSAEELTGIPASVAMDMRMTDLVDAYAEHWTDPSLASQVKGLLSGDWREPVTLVMERTPEALARSARQVRDLEITFFPIPQNDGTQHLGIVLRDVSEERDLRRRSDAFVSMASHELRTPMTSVLGFTELLLKRDPDPDTRREWLTAIHADSLHMATLVDEMLDVARIQAGQVHLNLAPVEVPEVTREVLAALRPMSERHHLVLETPGPLWAMADRTKLVQVVTNLVENAVKYSPAGGEVRVRVEPVRGGVRLVVSDKGVGIRPEDAQSVFNPFHRVHRTETEGIRGTGLGLYIVKAMVEQMKGTVTLESWLGKGTTITVVLPHADEPASIG
jgi:signal transduction histidine kinase